MTAPDPYIDDPDFRLYIGDVRETLALLPDDSIDCCVTSPPYWNLRDYGTDGQIGLEETPEAFVDALVEVFREVRRLLKPQGTLWLNLGDSYNAYNGNRGETGSTLEGHRQHRVGRPHVPSGFGRTAPSLKAKDLVGIPWRVAFALQQDGWYLRSDIIWSKVNPMPESVTDRPTKSHEYVFLLSKGPRYFFDQEAVREPYEGDPEYRAGRVGAYQNRAINGIGDGTTPSSVRGPDGRRKTTVKGTDGSLQHRDGERWPNDGRNIRSVWEIATQPYPDAHFAVFPEALPERCIKAGCPEFVCGTCGKPRERILDVSPMEINRSLRSHPKGHTRSSGTVTKARISTMVGFTDCGHDDYRTGAVLDPFMGSGTTALVARKLGRRSVGVELNPEYAALAAKRLQQLSLLAEETS